MLFGLILCGLNALAWWLDWSTSRKYIYYRLTEGNKWFANKSGYLDPLKSFLIGFLLIENGIAVGAFLFTYFLKNETQVNAEWYAFGCSYVLFALKHYFWGYRIAVKKAKANRIKQIAWREEIQGKSIEELEDWLQRFTTRNGESYVNYWAWVRVPGVFPDARPALARALYDWLQLTDLKKIWVDLSFHPKS